MDSIKSGFGELLEVMGEYLKQGLEHLPYLLGAAIILVLGWVLARLARRGIKGLARAANRLVEQTFPRGILAGLQLSALTITVASEVLFWIVILISWTVALRIAGLSAISLWLDRVSVYLPNLLAALVVFVIGFLISILVREQMAGPLKGHAGPEQRETSGKAAQGAIIAIAAIVGLDQLGIEVGLLVGLAIAIALAISVSLAIAFGLGAQRHLSNLIGIRSARQYLTAGDQIKVNDIEGQILEVHLTMITLDTEQGKILLPGHLFDEQISTIVQPEIESRDADD